MILDKIEVGYLAHGNLIGYPHLTNPIKRPELSAYEQSR